jgi:hypothetical protein
MLTKNQVEKNDRFHQDGCRTSICTDGSVAKRTTSYLKTSRVYVDSQRKGTWHVSLKKSDQNKVNVYRGQVLEGFHLPSECPLNPAVYTIKGFQLVLCKAHADVKEHDLGLEVTRGEPSSEKCIECELSLRKEKDVDLELLSRKTLLESLDQREKKSVRFGYWNPIGHNSSLYEFKPWTDSSYTYQDGVLSFSEYGEQKMKPESLISVDSSNKNSLYLQLIENAVNEYLKKHGNELC